MYLSIKEELVGQGSYPRRADAPKGEGVPQRGYGKGAGGLRGYPRGTVDSLARESMYHG